VLTNDFILAIIGCCLIAAITSTADSLLCAISSNVVQDFGIDLRGRKQLLFSQVVTCLAGLGGMGIAYFSQDILGVLSQSYGLLISCLFVPVLFCFTSWKLRKYAGGLSVVGGALAFILCKLAMLQGYDISPMMQVIIPLLVSGLGFSIGCFVKN